MSTEYSSFSQGQMQPPSMPQQQQPESSRPNDGYRIYFRKLRETYDHIQTGRLAQGGSSLLEASDALLTRVEELGMLCATFGAEFPLTPPGLTRDDENAHEQRLKMWKDFNLCWLAFMQKLKDNLDGVVQSGGLPPHPQSIVTPAFLDKMADKLIAWADSVEKYGLVDYETGVWEEEILEGMAEDRVSCRILTTTVAGECRSIFESSPDIFAALAPQQRPP